MAYHYPDSLREGNYLGAHAELQRSQQLVLSFRASEEPPTTYELNRDLRPRIETVFAPDVLSSIRPQGNRTRFWIPAVWLLELGNRLGQSEEPVQLTSDRYTGPLNADQAEHIATGFIQLGIAVAALSQQGHAKRSRRGIIFPAESAPENLDSFLAINHEPGATLQLLKLGPPLRGSATAKHLEISSVYAAQTSQLSIALAAATTVWTLTESNRVESYDTAVRSAVPGDLAAFAAPVLQYAGLRPQVSG